MRVLYGVTRRVLVLETKAIAWPRRIGTNFPVDGDGGPLE
jgi:hypothetical protein